MLVDLGHRADEPAVRELLARAIGRPTAERLAEATRGYAGKTWRLLGVSDDIGAVVGLIGLELLTRDTAAIRHIAVAEPRRLEGLGRRLILEARDQLGVSRLEAETDSRAVDFYRRCGFSIASASPRGGRERFLCTLDR